MVEIAGGKLREARRETDYERGETSSAKSSQNIKEVKTDKRFWVCPGGRLG